MYFVFRSILSVHLSDRKRIIFSFGRKLKVFVRQRHQIALSQTFLNNVVSMGTFLPIFAVFTILNKTENPSKDALKKSEKYNNIIMHDY